MSNIDARFAEFHAKNPHVYDRLESIALELFEAGRTHISLRDLWGFLRIQQLRTISSDPFKFNNDFTSRYSRILLSNHPELRAVVEIRDISASTGRGEEPLDLHEYMQGFLHC